MGIAAGVGHFFESILEVFQGIFAAILHAFQFVLQTFVDLGKGAVNFVEGTLGFAFRKLFFSHLLLLPSFPVIIIIITCFCPLPVECRAVRGGLQSAPISLSHYVMLIRAIYRQLLHPGDHRRRHLRLPAVRAETGLHARLAHHEEQISRYGKFRTRLIMITYARDEREREEGLYSRMSE